MARRKTNKRAENIADFAGPDAEQEAIAKLADAAHKANAKKGHNSGEVPEETIASHITLIKAAELEWRELRDKASQAQGVLRNRYKVAKGDGLDIDALKLAFRVAERSDAEFVSEHRNVGRYLRIMGASVGTQFGLFDFLDTTEDGKPPVGMDAELQGDAAYRNSEPPTNNPFQAGGEDHVAWRAGWGNAQIAAAKEMGRGSAETAGH